MSHDCRSKSGQTVGLIDAVIHVSREIVLRDLDDPSVKEALADLYSDDEGFAKLMQAAAAAYLEWKNSQ